MATDLEKLVVQLSADFSRFEKEMAKAVGVSNKQFAAVERRARQMNKNLDSILARSFKGLSAPLAGIGAALGAREIMRLADTWSELNSRVNNAAGGIEAGGEVMQRLGEVARRTYSSLEQTAEGYLLNATAMRELGYSTNQTLDYVESVNNALVISGAKGQVAARVMDALSKAMALGKLQGDNLNTVIASGGRLAEALASGLGVGVNQLRALGAQGKITGRDIVRSLSSQMENLRKEAEEMPATISDGIQLLQNALLEYVGNADQATGVSAKTSEALVIMADNFDKTADVALQLAAVIAGALVGRSLAGMIARLGLAGTALINFTRALRAAQTMGGLAVAFGGLGAAAAPAGLIIGGAVVSSLILFSNRSDEASAGADRFAARLEALKGKAEESADAVEAAGERYNEALKNALGHEVTAAEESFEAAHAAALKAIDGAIEYGAKLQIVRDEAGNLSRQPMASPEQMDDLQRIRDELEKNAGGAKEAKNELFALANANPNFQTLADQMQPLLDTLALVAQSARDAKAELAAVSGMEGAGVSAAAQRSGPGQARRALQARKEESRVWEAEQTRRAQLGKDQLALENEIARVKKQAADDGIRVTDDQIKRIAEANLAGNTSRSAEGKKLKKEREDEWERLTNRIVEQTEALRTEYQALDGLNPLVDDYGRAVTEAALAQDMVNAALKAGVKGATELHDIQELLHGDLTKMSPAARELAEAIREAVKGYADADVVLQQLRESQDETRQSAEEWMDVQRDVTKGLINDLVAGKSAAEAFSNALSKVADKLLNEVLDAIFQVKNEGSGGIFGFLGSLLGGGFRANTTAGAFFGATGAPGFASGTANTGGQKGQPRGVVHGQEAVIPLPSGGKVPVELQMPRIPDILPAASGETNITYAPTYNIDAPGGNPDEVVRKIEQYDKGRLARLAKDLPELRRRGALT